MAQESGKKEEEFNSTAWYRHSRPRLTNEEAIAFWEWLIKANGIRERDFVRELKREGDATKALERRFAKINKSAALRQKLPGSGKRCSTR